ncbi:hypothetical protein Golax_023092 [Gossypium laxum]|uniref:Protein kinase domain-containing protein n=1 Tax=Gossypium laxum TaxID=34288 RepID=A0A7J9B3E2_9ROSI|nr:hypothetical protein [Gossypium laxum]
MSEISSLGRLRHRNLIQLLGWCRRRGDLLLVYDFMANGSLDKLLFDNPKTILNWDHRFRIVKGSTRVVGTLGYQAPELFKTGKATTSSDVYAFGALLLEVACERRPVEHKALPEEMVLVDWVWEKYRQDGFICSNDVPALRPSMRQIMLYLDGEAELPENLRPPAAFDGNAEEAPMLHDSLV